MHFKGVFCNGGFQCFQGVNIGLIKIGIKILKMGFLDDITDGH
jgi:hypothetical protein